VATRRAIGAAAGFELLKAEGSIRKRKETRFHELSTREGVKGKPESKEQPRFSSNLSASSPKLGQRMTTSITNKVVVIARYPDTTLVMPVAMQLCTHRTPCCTERLCVSGLRSWSDLLPEFDGIVQPQSVQPTARRVVCACSSPRFVPVAHYCWCWGVPLKCKNAKAKTEILLQFLGVIWSPNGQVNDKRHDSSHRRAAQFECNSSRRFVTRGS
jgi:hypothetical protein